MPGGNMDAWLAKTQGGTAPPSSTQSGPPNSGPGSQGNVNTNPADDWIGSSQDTSVYYGDLPQSQGNTNVNVSNPSGGNYQGPSVNNNDGSSGSDNNTGSGATGGTGSSQGAAGSGITNLAAITAAQKFLGKRQPALDGLIQDNLETYGLTGKQNINDLTQLDPPNTNTDNSSIINKIQEVGKNLEDEYNDLRTFDLGGGQLQLDPDISGGFKNPGATWEKPVLGGNLTLGADYNTSDNQGNIFGGFTTSWKDGGPVGLMSLPQGYAAGGGVDPSDWRVLEQIIAAGGNPEDYGYENGGPVSEEESYIEDYLKSLQQPQTQPPTPEEYKPFGGTRERVMDQVEAFDNAPHHIEEPMIGMWGEQIPLTTARRVQGYMEGLDPVKRGLIEEMMQMFHMKNMMEKHQEQQETGQFFGPQPKEYSI